LYQMPWWVHTFSIGYWVAQFYDGRRIRNPWVSVATDLRSEFLPRLSGVQLPC